MFDKIKNIAIKWGKTLGYFKKPPLIIAKKDFDKVKVENCAQLFNRSNNQVQYLYKLVNYNLKDYLDLERKIKIYHGVIPDTYLEAKAIINLPEKESWFSLMK